VTVLTTSKMRALALAVFGGLLLALLSLPGTETPRVQAAGRYRARIQKIARGMTLTRLVDREGPNRIRVLKVDPRTALTLDVELANNKVPGHETTSSMASRNNAIAAINGDYTMVPSDRQSGRPIDAFAEDGELVTSSLIWGRNFALSKDERHAFIGHADIKATLTTKAGAIVDLPHWNELFASPNQLYAFTPKGGSEIAPPRYGCEVRLMPQGKRTWGDQKIGVLRSYVVDAARCASDGALARKGGIVIAARPRTPAAESLMATLTPGLVVSMDWSLGELPGILDTIGGNPSLLENGRVTVGTCTGSYFCDRNPRTGIGFTKTGKILLVTVDGRQDDSVGMTLMGFAKLFRHLGAVSALNLDGGGSTTMWVKGNVVNKPSGVDQRPVGSSILVLPGRDRREPKIMGARAAASPSDTSGGDPCAALRDPASTGGFLQALESGSFGNTVPMSSDLRDAVDVYRGDLTCGEFRHAINN
jgi:hypothetical protein